MPVYSDLREGRVLITGGANGIGAAMVRAFHGQGALVFFCDTDVAAGQSLAAELGSRVTFAKVDLTREAQVIRWLRLASECSRLMIATTFTPRLRNSSAISIGTTLHPLDDATITESFSDKS